MTTFSIEEREATFTESAPVATDMVAAWITVLAPPQVVSAAATSASRLAAIEDATAGFPFALPATAPVAQAAALMAYEGVEHVAIVGDRGRIIGLLTALDAARALAVAAGYSICA